MVDGGAQTRGNGCNESDATPPLSPAPAAADAPVAAPAGAASLLPSAFGTMPREPKELSVYGATRTTGRNHMTSMSRWKSITRIARR